MKFSIEDKGSPLVNWLCATTLVKSKAEARRLIESGGFYLNDKRITDPTYEISTDDIIGGNKLLFRKGKRDYFMISFNNLVVE